jgi:hypothetical protein
LEPQFGKLGLAPTSAAAAGLGKVDDTEGYSSEAAVVAGVEDEPEVAAVAILLAVV